GCAIAWSGRVAWLGPGWRWSIVSPRSVVEPGRAGVGCGARPGGRVGRGCGGAALALPTWAGVCAAAPRARWQWLPPGVSGTVPVVYRQLLAQQARQAGEGGRAHGVDGAVCAGAGRGRGEAGGHPAGAAAADAPARVINLDDLQEPLLVHAGLPGL